MFFKSFHMDCIQSRFDVEVGNWLVCWYKALGNTESVERLSIYVQSVAGGTTPARPRHVDYPVILSSLGFTCVARRLQRTIG